MLAEFRGRREARFRNGVRYIAVCAAGAAAVTEVLEGFRPDGGASALRLALAGRRGAVRGVAVSPAAGAR